MSDRKTVATRVVPETAQELQTIVDARDVSKSEYLRAVLKERLEDDYDDLSDEDQIQARIEELMREVKEEEDNSDTFTIELLKPSEFLPPF